MRFLLLLLPLLLGCVPAPAPEAAGDEAQVSNAPLENAAQDFARSQAQAERQARIDAAPEEVRDFIGRSDDCARWSNSTVATIEEIRSAQRELRCNQLLVDEQRLRRGHGRDAEVIRLLDEVAADQL